MPLTQERTLHVVSPLMSGADVLEVQERLDELGYSPGALDGYYGVASQTAVRAFQRDHGLEDDGVVGPMTRAALEDAEVGEAEPPTPSTAGLAALEEALLHLGVKESPPNSNRTPFGEWFGVDGVKWCNVFVSYAFAIGAGVTLCEGYRGAGVYDRGCTYVPTTEAWLRATGRWKGRTQPLPGDIAIFNWDGGQPDHIGIVERDLGDGTFLSVEGNTGATSDSDGGEVQRRTRSVSQVNGFGRLD